MRRRPCCDDPAKGDRCRRSSGIRSCWQRSSASSPADQTRRRRYRKSFPQSAICTPALPGWDWPGPASGVPDATETTARGALVLLQDRTLQARMEQTRGDFVANVSHELRTPLASLTGFLETLRGPAAHDPEAQDRFLQIMEEQTARMTRLVDTLLSLSRLEMVPHAPPGDLVDLATTVWRVVDALRIVANRFETGIAVRADDGPTVVAGDRDQVAQVVRNLIENAIKYGAPGTMVTVCLKRISRPDGDRIALSVIDQGDGIPEEHLPRLTERFYRVDVARARNGGMPTGAARDTGRGRLPFPGARFGRGRTGSRDREAYRGAAWRHPGNRQSARGRQHVYRHPACRRRQSCRYPRARGLNSR